jgi:hypothetical protein
MVRATPLSLGDAIRSELTRRDIVPSPASESEIQIDLRKMYGAAAAAIAMKEKIKEAVDKSGIILIDSLCSPQELDEILKLGAQTISFAIHTHKSIRFARLSDRINRPMSVDEATYRDKVELDMLGKGVTIAQSDYHFTNNDSIESSIEPIIHRIKLVTETLRG